ncbi:IS66 family insertion sequence element accessory protein TnpA [Methylomonas paludis]
MVIPEKWLKHIESWQRSGLNQADYCRQQQINYTTF